jgi:hypothetical protein
MFVFYREHIMSPLRTQQVNAINRFILGLKHFCEVTFEWNVFANEDGTDIAVFIGQWLSPSKIILSVDDPCPPAAICEVLREVDFFMLLQIPTCLYHGVKDLNIYAGFLYLHSLNCRTKPRNISWNISPAEAKYFKTICTNSDWLSDLSKVWVETAVV